jgi:integrase/recombinase XerC
VRAGISKGSKERVVPLPKRAREALNAYLEERPEHAGDALFTGRQGQLSADGVAAVVAKYAEWARLEGVTPHVLRHTFAYNFLANNNNDLVALADILGHSPFIKIPPYVRRSVAKLSKRCSTSGISWIK